MILHADLYISLFRLSHRHFFSFPYSPSLLPTPFVLIQTSHLVSWLLHYAYDLCLVELGYRASPSIPTHPLFFELFQSLPYYIRLSLIIFQFFFLIFLIPRFVVSFYLFFFFYRGREFRKFSVILIGKCAWFPSHNTIFYSLWRCKEYSPFSAIYLISSSD